MRRHITTPVCMKDCTAWLFVCSVFTVAHTVRGCVCLSCVLSEGVQVRERERCDVEEKSFSRSMHWKNCSRFCFYLKLNIRTYFLCLLKKDVSAAEMLVEHAWVLMPISCAFHLSGGRVYCKSSSRGRKWENRCTAGPVRQPIQRHTDEEVRGEKVSLKYVWTYGDVRQDQRPHPCGICTLILM